MTFEVILLVAVIIVWIGWRFVPRGKGYGTRRVLHRLDPRDDDPLGWDN